MPLLPLSLDSYNVPNGMLRLDKESVLKKPPPASRRKTSYLTDHSRAPQQSHISLDSNHANNLTN